MMIDKDKISFILDFDGTMAEHDFRAPVKKEIPGAVLVVKALIKAGHRAILSTMRSNMQTCTDSDAKVSTDVVLVPGKYLDEAVEWLKDRGIELYGIQKDPHQHEWTESTKPYGQLIIDAICLGIPLTKDSRGHRCVDWLQVYLLLVHQRLLSYDSELAIRISNECKFGFSDHKLA